VKVPVIDLFAGPGGLSEGFAQFEGRDGCLSFKIVLSIEKDEHAHQTLELRSFFCQFATGKAPSEYYSYLRGEISRDYLFGRFRTQATAARKEAWRAELGNEARCCVYDRITKHLSNAKLWVLLGGPPCQAYSLVGRARLLGESTKRYEQDSRHFLYQEYLRILADHGPSIFIFENVKGLLSSVVKGSNTFQCILTDLRSPKNAWRVTSGTVKTGQFDYRLFPLAVRGRVHSPFFGFCCSSIV